MTFYLVGGAGASPAPVVSAEHLPSLRARRYPSDTTDAAPRFKTATPDPR